MFPWRAIAETPDWTPWGSPRMCEHGVETAFHHRLVLIRSPVHTAPQVVAPGDVFVGGEASGLEWSPMVWALRGRRECVSFSELTPSSAMRGDRDRLFNLGQAACEQIFEGGMLGARGLKRWIDAMTRRVDYCEARGIIYRHLIIPEAHVIYADAAPHAPKPSEDRPLMQFLRAGGERLRERIVYPLDAMTAGRATFDTALPHDVHCTGYGFFLCYRELIASLPNIDPAAIAQESELQAREIFVAGDVARGAGLPGRRVAFHDAPHPKINSVVKGQSYSTHQVDVMESENTALPRLVMFRTSNSTHLFPYLMRHFSRIAAVATINVYYELIESEKPDVVIAEMPERYFAPGPPSLDETDFAMPPQDSVNAFAQRTGHSLPLPRGETATTVT